MSTRRFDDGNDLSPNKRWIYAIVGIFLGVSLLFFSPPELLRAGFGSVPPGTSFLWFIVGVVLLVFGITNLVPALNLSRDQTYPISEEALQRETERKAERSNDIEAKLHTLRQLKDPGLILLGKNTIGSALISWTNGKLFTTSGPVVDCALDSSRDWHRR